MVIEICWFLLILGISLGTIALARIARYVSEENLNKQWQIKKPEEKENDRKNT